MKLAYWVSSHGFGHAARSAAVIDALFARADHLGLAQFEVMLFAGTPRWFFEQSAGGRLDPRCTYRSWSTDVGLVQATAMVEDLEASVAELGRFLPLRADAVESAVEVLRQAEVDCLVADISPLGLAAAQRLGLPTVLVENFTWDWIYRGYADPRLDRFAEAVAPLFDAVDLRLRTRPFCPLPASAPTSQRTVELPPIARRALAGRAETRAALGIAEHDPLVMVTMGGVPWDWHELDRQLEEYSWTGVARSGPDDATAEGGQRWLVVAGACPDDGENGGMERHGQVILLAHRSPLYHPDLVAAADAVVAKLGYSTVAEVAVAGTRLGYIPRPRFPESPPLESWVQGHLANRRIEVDALESGAWLGELDALLAEPTRPARENGADGAAREILERR